MAPATELGAAQVYVVRGDGGLLSQAGVLGARLLNGHSRQVALSQGPQSRRIDEAAQ